MLGLGETDEEIPATMDDLRAIGVDILALGQYLQPTRNHLPVQRWVSPEEFNRLRDIGLERASWKSPPARWCAPATAPTGYSRRTTWAWPPPPRCRPATERQPDSGAQPELTLSAKTERPCGIRPRAFAWPLSSLSGNPGARAVQVPGAAPPRRATARFASRSLSWTIFRPA